MDQIFHFSWTSMISYPPEIRFAAHQLQIISSFSWIYIWRFRSFDFPGCTHLLQVKKANTDWNENLAWNRCTDEGYAEYNCRSWQRNTGMVQMQSWKVCRVIRISFVPFRLVVFLLWGLSIYHRRNLRYSTCLIDVIKPYFLHLYVSRPYFS